ncbi:UNVERIFIED_CONTAM: hypothetical protein FKN15_000659 [Acipenser sinensis]
MCSVPHNKENQDDDPDCQNQTMLSKFPFNSVMLLILLMCKNKIDGQTLEEICTSQ